MIYNDKIEPYRWYKHPGMHDTVLRCVGIKDGIAEIQWFNLSIENKRKFFIDTDYVKLDRFKVSPHWEDVSHLVDNIKGF